MLFGHDLSEPMWASSKANCDLKCAINNEKYKNCLFGKSNLIHFNSRGVQMSAQISRNETELSFRHSATDFHLNCD